jgi:cysteine dioxygenase
MDKDWTHNLITPKHLLGWELPEAANPSLALATLVHRLRVTDVQWAQLESLVCFDRERYHRKVLYRSNTYEVVLNCWLPGQGSALHDHGGSCGVTRVLMGRLWETWFEASERGLSPVGERPVREGGLMVEREETIHRVENRGRRAAISLHIYTPPLVQMATYPEDTRVLSA